MVRSLGGNQETAPPSGSVQAKHVFGPTNFDENNRVGDSNGKLMRLYCHRVSMQHGGLRADIVVCVLGSHRDANQ